MAPRGTAALPSRRALVIARRGRFQVATPLFERGEQLPVARGRVRVGEGQIALCRVDGRGAQPIADLGRADRARDVVGALLADRGVRPTFPRRLEEEASAATGAAREGDRERRDLREAPTFTVDPRTARDFDDAVSAQREGDGYRLWVHIADVAAHVPAGGGLDREAAERANSTYAPGTVAPMLPRALSDEACSLNPEVDRLAVTAEIELGGDGAALRTSFYRSVIRSDARLDYEELDRIFSGRERPPERIADPIAAARAAAAAIADRAGGAALAVQGSEPEFAFDEAGNVTSAHSVEQTESHRLIERLMILTNEQVASLLERKGVPALYRIHEPPDPARIEHLLDQLDSLDVPTPPLPDDLAPGRAAMLVAEASRLVAREAERRGHGSVTLSSLVLRSLKQARYSERNLGHAGLGSPAYAHFTSPIRRYPDLIAHRALLSVIGAGGAPPEPGEVAAAAGHCSERERESMRLERDGDDICLAFLLERELHERGWDAPFEGEVSGVVGAGAFVRFVGELADVYEGFLPARLVPGERYELNALETALVGARSGARLGFGDRVRVAVTGVEAPRGRVDLRPLEQADRTARSGRARGAERAGQARPTSPRPKRGRKGAGPRRRGR